MNLIESGEDCEEQCAVGSEDAGCQSCIEEKLISYNSSECLNLSSAGCFYCTRSVMLDSLACADNNNNLENIVKCIEDKQETGCKNCVCSVLCYVHAEGDLCRECLQNPNLATFFLNSDKCQQSWTWSNITSTCYRAFLTPRPWKYAARFCENGGGLLAQPKTTSSIYTVLEAIQLQAKAAEYWIGAREFHTGAGVGGWPDKYIWTQDNSTMENMNWETGYPQVPAALSAVAATVDIATSTTTYIWTPNYPRDYDHNYYQVTLLGINSIESLIQNSTQVGKSVKIIETVGSLKLIRENFSIAGL